MVKLSPGFFLSTMNSYCSTIIRTLLYMVGCGYDALLDCQAPLILDKYLLSLYRLKNTQDLSDQARRATSTFIFRIIHCIIQVFIYAQFPRLLFHDNRDFPPNTHIHISF